MTHDRNHPDPIGSWSMNEGLDEILRKSCSLMARQGYHGTSMRDLAEATGRSLSGLYHYFRGKEDLLFLINFYGFSTLNESWQNVARSVEGARQKLYGFIYFHTNYFVHHLDEMRVMIWGTQVLNLEKARIVQKLKDRYTKALSEIIGNVHRELAAGEMDDRRLERETFLLFGMMNWVFSWYSPRRHGAVSDLVNDTYRTFLSGIGGEVDAADLERLATEVGRSFRKNKTASMWAPQGDNEWQVT